jgi:hypothetical protein
LYYCIEALIQNGIEGRAMRKLVSPVFLGLVISVIILIVAARVPSAMIPWIMPIGFPFAVLAVFAIQHGFTLNEGFLRRWSSAHGVEVTPENRDSIIGYLRRGRRIRTIGALAGFLGYSLWAFFSRGDDHGVSWLTATFAGYLLGAAAAEAWAFRPQLGARRTASLSPRLITDYVPRYSIVVMRATTAAIVSFAVAWRYIPLRRPILHESRVLRPDLGKAVVWTIVASVVALVVEATARRIVRRPQPVTSRELVVVDDAIRSTAMHGLMGAGLALQLGILAGLAGMWTGIVRVTGVEALLAILTVVGGFGAMFAWLRLGVDQPWIVRRSRPQPEVAA